MNDKNLIETPMPRDNGCFYGVSESSVLDMNYFYSDFKFMKLRSWKIKKIST